MGSSLPALGMTRDVDCQGNGVGLPLLSFFGVKEHLNQVINECISATGCSDRDLD